MNTKTVLTAMFLVLPSLMLSCEKSAQQKQAELNQQKNADIAEVRQEANAEKRDIRSEAAEDLATDSKEAADIRQGRDTDLAEVNAEAAAEIADIQKEAREESRDIYLAAIKNREKVLETRIDRFEDRTDDLKNVTAEQADWIAKVSGAESRLEKARELVDESKGESWMLLRPVVTEAYMNLYSTLSSAEKNVAAARM